MDLCATARAFRSTSSAEINSASLRPELDPQRYAGRSLRSGFLTSAARVRANIFSMADQSRYKSLDMLREYLCDAERFDRSARSNVRWSGPCAHHAGTGLLRASEAT